MKTSYSNKKEDQITQDQVVDEVYNFLDKWESDELYIEKFEPQKRERVFSNWLSNNQKNPQQLTPEDILDFADFYNEFRKQEEEEKSIFIPLGEKVRVIKSVDKGKVQHYGTGVYIGRKVPQIKDIENLKIIQSMGYRVPCVMLDGRNVQYAWSFQGWFVPEKEFEANYEGRVKNIQTVELTDNIFPVGKSIEETILNEKNFLG